MPIYPSTTQVLFNSAVVYNGSGDTQKGYLTTGPIATVSGTINEDYVGPFYHVIRDSANSSGSPLKLSHGHVIRHSFSGTTGARSASLVEMSMANQPSSAEQTTPSTGYVSHQARGWVQVNAGGVGGDQNTTTTRNWKGEWFGRNANVWMASGATYWNSIIGDEIDVSVYTGASVSRKIGFFIVQTSLDRVAGEHEDAGIAFANQGASCARWDYGILFGTSSSYWSFRDDSTLIGVQDQAATGVLDFLDRTALYGVDFSNVEFQTGGAGFLAPLITPSAANATGKAGSIVWDADYIYICTATDTWKRVAIATWP